VAIHQLIQGGEEPSIDHSTEEMTKGKQKDTRKVMQGSEFSNETVHDLKS
jgi:hypothetical protein